MTRALVLGGGGPVGIAWEVGLSLGLAKRGVDLRSADAIIGTSAGSNVGAQVALGSDLEVWAEERVDLSISPDDSAAPSGSMAARLGALMEQMIALNIYEGTPEEGRARLGQFALAQDVGPEERFTALFADLGGADWPATFSCTAVSATTGEFVVWNQDSGVDLQLAVASSCCVPGIFPPITIGDDRYIDGGMRSALNADLAAGHDQVLVVSCMSSSTPGLGVQEEIDGLRAGGATVELIEPDQAFIDISGSGMFLMDDSRMPAAFGAGLALADVEAERVSALWRS